VRCGIRLSGTGSPDATEDMFEQETFDFEYTILTEELKRAWMDEMGRT
jgi:hypothetical protein